MKITLVFYDKFACIQIFIFVYLIIFVPCLSMSLFSKLNNSFKESLKNVTAEKLTYDFIKPPDHLKAVKMERDGHLNKDFRKEILLGSIVKNGTEDEKLLISIHEK